METQQNTAAVPLRIQGLSVTARIAGQLKPLVSGIDLQVGPNEVVGLVGESGSGKSVTCRSALGLFPPGAEVSGSVQVGGVELVGTAKSALAEVRRHKASMIFQDPRSSINPVRTVGDYVTEGLIVNGASRAAAKQTAIEILDAVGIATPAQAFDRYPHEFSGGMLQRIVIAGALSVRPQLLLADEATTALDVTTQAEVILLLKQLQKDFGTGLVFVTHDLDLASALCDRIYVMYAGGIVESAPAAELFEAPQHPYTVGLLNSSPKLSGPQTPLQPIPGRPQSLSEVHLGCAFRDRCALATAACETETPKLMPHGTGQVACIRPGEMRVL